MELNKIPERMVLRARDIMNIIGCSKRTASRIMMKIRLVFGKESDELITWEEFCAVTGLPEESVRKYIR